MAELGPAATVLGTRLNPCTNWNISLDGQDVMSLWEMSWAYVSARPPHFSASTTPVNVQVADFLPGGAAKQLGWDSAFAARCHTYHDPSDGSLVTITATPTTGVGDQGLYIQLANPYDFGGTTIRAHTNVLLVRAGANMIAVGQSGTDDGATAPVVPYSDLEQAAAHYLNSVARVSSG
jgi:hypothetical protein